MTYPNNNNKILSPFDVQSDHEDLSETEFLKNAIANHTKYGSTNCNFDSPNFRFITHYIEPTDTLQGISLKYGCKIENIKKFNKLFSDDNNHLRSRFSIVVPIETKTKIQFDSDLSSSQSSQSSLDPGKRIASNNTNFANHLNNHTNNNNCNDLTKSPKFEPRNSYSFDNAHGDTTKNKDLNLPNKSISFSDNDYLNDHCENESVADFLIRIDSSIARTKNQVENFSKRVASTSIENELNKINSKKFNPPKLSSDKSLFSSASSNNIFDQDHHLPKVSVNRNKKIKSSLKRLEKAQEEIFEL